MTDQNQYERGVKAERSRIIHRMLAFQGLVMGPDTEPQVLSMWAFMMQDILGIDGIGEKEEVAARYIEQLSDLDISADLIRALEEKYKIMFSMLKGSLRFAGVKISGAGNETEMEMANDDPSVEAFNFMLGKSNEPPN